MQVTVNDYTKLLDQMEFGSIKMKMPRIVEQLYDALMSAKMLPPQNIPSNVITMNSKVLLKDLSSGGEMELSISYPKDADDQERKVSVFSDIGIALLGQQAGDTVSWKVPDGNGQFEILRVTYQPEADGDYYS
jgi:regulator of nucleoside diphosphate kinase